MVTRVNFLHWDIYAEVHAILPKLFPVHIQITCDIGKEPF